MLPKAAAVAALFAVLSVAGTAGQQPPAEALQRQIASLRKAMTGAEEKLAAVLNPPEPPSSTAPLPEPSLTEPFGIGEALYDEGRLADAVVSLLKLMQIAIVPDANASARATGITLSEAEVRALIDLGTEDLAAAGNEMERIPYSFADLHAGIAELLPGVSVEQLAESYTKAYQARPEDLIAKALMGQPLEPDTKLTRAQIWFLTMDGFAGAAATGGNWGTADREVPDLKSPTPQWSAAEFREVLARLPLLTASRLVTITAPDVVSQGATVGPPVNVTARVAASPPPMVSRVTGKSLFAARAGSLAGQEVTWHIDEESILPEFGKVVTSVDEPVTVGAAGLAQFVFQPGADPTRGAGEPVDDWEPIEARFQTRGLLASAYAVPAPLASLTLGSTRSRGNVRLRSRSKDVLYLGVSNAYTNINFDIPRLGGGTRNGVDTLFAVVRKLEDGTYRGSGTVHLDMTQTLRGPTGPTVCNSTMVTSQRLRVRLVPITADTLRGRTSSAFPMGPTRTEDHYLWADAQGNPGASWRGALPDGGYYRLIIYPLEDPYLDRRCVPNIPAEEDRRTKKGKWFIPLNDAQWTTSGQGYPIALKARGSTNFFDLSSWNPLGETDEFGRKPLAPLQALFQLTGRSLWVVMAGRSMKEFLALFR